MVIDRYVNLALLNHQHIPKASEIDSFMKSTLHGTVDDIHLEKQTIRIEHILKSQYFINRESEKVRMELLTESIQQLSNIIMNEPIEVARTDELARKLHMKSDLNIHLMFNNLAPVEGLAKDEKGKRILLDGAPGVGKTTLCHNACKEWADGKAFTDFKLMVYVPLRERQVVNASEIEHLFCYGKRSLREAVAEEIQDTDGKDVLLVLDGWDELSPEQREVTSLLCKIMQRKILTQCTILITSRPHASQWLRNPKVCERHIEIFGFTDRQINQCILNMLNPESAKDLLRQLEIRSDVKTLCYIPMNLAMILYIFDRLGKLPNTLTGIYNSFTNNALLRYLQNYDLSVEPVTVLSSREALPSEVKELFKALCQVAYDGLMKDKMVFTKEELDSYHPLLTASSNTLGLLTAFKGFTESGVELHYQFLHLTIQEFLAAEALVQNPADFQTKFVFEHLNDGWFRMMICFIFGRAKHDDIKHVLDFIYATISSVSGNTRFLYLCHMLFEARSVQVIKEVGENLPPHVTDLPFGFRNNLFDWMVVGRFLSFISTPIRSLNMRNCRFSEEEFRMLTKSLSKDCVEVSIEELYFTMSQCPTHDIAPLILHPVFQTTRYLDIDICNAPEIAAITFSSIVKMPGLTGLHVHFRPPHMVDNTLDRDIGYITKQENPAIAIQDLFEAMAHNPKISFLKVTEYMNMNIKPRVQLFDVRTSMALINMIETRDSTISFYFRIQLFSKSFIEHFSNYVATSKKIKELNFDEDLVPQDKRMSAKEVTLLFNALKYNTFLHSFALSNTKLMFQTTETDAQALEEMLSTNFTLEKLKLENCPLLPLNVAAISKGLLANQTLTELFLDHIESDPGPIVDALASNSTLSTLQLNRCNLEDKHEPSISRMLRNGSIKSLNLNSNNLGSPGALGLFTALCSDSVKLEELSLSGNNLHESDMLATVVEEALSNNQVLRVLSLDECSLHPSVIEGIATSLACNSVLESLSLRGNKIIVLCVWQLCTVLQVNTGLQTLKLYDSIMLDGATVHQVIELVKFNSTLKNLELQYHHFYDKISFQLFIDALRMNSTLTSVRIAGLENFHLDTINFNRLKQNLPVVLVRSHADGRLP
jgi:GTPase SAR1 family protein